MRIDQAGLLEVSKVMFMSNKASLGGAVYVAAIEDEKQTIFSECVFERNEAADGGALYLYTGSGADIFNSSIFRKNFAGELLRISSVCEIELSNALQHFCKTLVTGSDKTPSSRGFNVLLFLNYECHTRAGSSVHPQYFYQTQWCLSYLLKNVRYCVHTEPCEALYKQSA